MKKQKDLYTESFLKYGSTPEAVKWSNKETQYLRFERLINQFGDSITGSVIHDVGSGLCDFHQFLNERKILHKYSGTELVDEMIDFSKIRFPGICLYNRDFMTIDAIEKYDFIVLSGVLNLKLENDDSEGYENAYKMIKKMFEHSTKAISFNMLSTYNTFSQKDLMYFDPTVITDFCIKNLSRFVNVDSSYPLYEFTVTLFHEEFIKQEYSDNIFAKYLMKL